MTKRSNTESGWNARYANTSSTLVAAADLVGSVQHDSMTDFKKWMNGLGFVRINEFQKAGRSVHRLCALLRVTTLCTFESENSALAVELVLPARIKATCGRAFGVSYCPVRC
jgi:hypothetical protein